MPPKHRKMIEDVEKRSKAKDLISQSKKLMNVYNNCLEEIRKFRAMHLEYAATYIHKQAQVHNIMGVSFFRFWISNCDHRRLYFWEMDRYHYCCFRTEYRCNFFIYFW